MEWKEVRLGDVCSIQRGASPRPIQKFISKEGMPWVKIADATGISSRYISSTSEYIIKEGISKSRIVHPGDLIVSNSATPGLPKFMAIEACVHDGWLIIRDLDGIDKVKISNETFEGVKKEVTDTELTEDVSTRVQGKIVYTTITLKSDTSKDKAKEIASATLDNYSEDELKFYDFSFFLKWKGEEGDTVVTGNKHHSLDSITWTNN